MTTLDPRGVTAAYEAQHAHKSDPGRKGSGLEKAITAYIDALSSLPAQAVKPFASSGYPTGSMASAADDDQFAARLADGSAALAPSQPAAVGVTDEMVEAIVQAVRPYTLATLFLDEHRDLVRAALRITP